MGRKRVAGEEALSAGEIAPLFGVDAKTITRYANAGSIPSFKTPGGHVRFRVSEIKPYLESTVPLGGDDGDRDRQPAT